jgi:hypothetical protein
VTVVANCSFNSFSSTKALHTVTALIEIGAGLALLCFPSVTVTLLVGSPLETSAAQTVARVGGAAAVFLHSVMTVWCVACLRQKSPEYGNGH